MKKLVSLIELPVGRVATAALMAILWGFFAYRHFIAFQATGEWTYILIGISELAAAVLLACRSVPETVSVDPVDWLLAINATFMPLLLSPSSWGVLPIAKNLIIVASVLQILGLLSLNRSLALVAAKRKLKFGGMYRFIRHPLYASYVVMTTGYVLANSTLMNAFIYFLGLGFLFARMLREEKHLSHDPAYRAYMQAVPFRLVPFIV